MTHNVNHKNHA